MSVKVLLVGNDELEKKMDYILGMITFQTARQLNTYTI